MEKCAALAVKRKEVECDGIVLDEGRVIQSVDNKGCNKLGLLEKREVCQQKMKGNVKQKYAKLVKSITKFKLDARNAFQ